MQPQPVDKPDLKPADTPPDQVPALGPKQTPEDAEVVIYPLAVQ